eukprot:9485197-Pyramimonas_sp.AAC.1
MAASYRRRTPSTNGQPIHVHFGQRAAHRQRGLLAQLLPVGQVLQGGVRCAVEPAPRARSGAGSQAGS